MNLTEYMLLSMIQLIHLQLQGTNKEEPANKIFNDLVDRVNEKEEPEQPSTTKSRFFRGKND
jgi:hypothetical protein